MELEIRFENEYGEEFVTSRKVDEDWCDLDELEFLQNTYKNFLNNLGYATGYGDEVIIQHKVTDEENTYVGNVNLTINTLNENAKEIANLVAEEFSKAHSNTGFKNTIIAV